ncbi:hypothetical protein DPMN_010310 [Dreissena polymorpha]|uniref:Uncharacterized protein n=1 Tax=Dreissena polymorpha TaxID=45954 RepID=A0A9D4RZ42_DREPO|nr:hypothetical protein DPMN_010310 [Dreissena polymorpha]
MGGGGKGFWVGAVGFCLGGIHCGIQVGVMLVNKRHFIACIPYKASIASKYKLPASVLGPTGRLLIQQ